MKALIGEPREEIMILLLHTLFSLAVAATLLLTSEPWSDWFGASWLTLRPEPCYRNTHGTTPFLLDASSLPTYKKVEGQEYHYGKSQKEKEAARNAISAAIDKGLITKEGLVR